MFLVKQNLILSRVKVYLAVKPGMAASSVTRDLGSFHLVALPSSTSWSKTAAPPPALVATFQSAAGGGERQGPSSFLLRAQPRNCTNPFHLYPIGQDLTTWPHLPARETGTVSFAMND